MDRFPWSHLFKEVDVEETDDITDTVLHKRNADKLTAELKDTTQKLSKLRELSEKTFDEMKNVDNMLELEFNVLVQMVLAAKEKLEGDAWRKRVLKGVLLWLQQRHNLVKYLHKHDLHPEVCAKLEKLLFISKQDILDVVTRLSFTD